MWSGAVHPLNDTLHFLELFHEMRLAVQAPRRVRKQHINAASSCGLHGIESHRATIRTSLLRDERCACAVRPHIQLLDNRRAKGISRREHHTALLTPEAPCKLAD